MIVKIRHSKLSGTIKAIASKSFAQRIIIASALCETKTRILLNRVSGDILSTLKAVSGMGAKYNIGDGYVDVFPMKKSKTADIFCGESGTAARLLLPVGCALFESGTVSGEGSLIKRPFETLCRCIGSHGVEFSSYTLPISFNSNMQNGVYEISGSESSQYVSGLMFALPLLKGSSDIVLTSPLESSGYVDITMEVLKKYGVTGGSHIAGQQIYQSPGEITVEGDWSNAAFFIAGGVEVEGLTNDSLQKDRAFTFIKDEKEIDLSEIPDLLPILAVYAAVHGKETHFYGGKRLKIKESNRLSSVACMINNLGGRCEVDGDRLNIFEKKLTGGTVDSCNDHRIVMAAAIAASYCANDVIINNAQAVAKSYPEFFDDYKQVGGNIHVNLEG